MASPKQISIIHAHRSAGHSIREIAIAANTSESTVKRVLKKHPIPKGAAIDKMAQAAQEELVKKFTSDEHLKLVYAGIISSTLEQVTQARDIAAELLPHFETAKDAKEAAAAMRGLSSHALTLKGHNDSLRQLLPGMGEQTSEEELPVIEIVEMTEQDVAQIRAQQEEEARIISGERQTIGKKINDEVEPKAA